MELLLSTGPAKSKVAILAGAFLELNVNLLIKSATGQSLHRELNVPVSQQFTEPGGSVLSFAGREGTSVVVILESR
jgi:hypothetical protein